MSKNYFSKWSKRLSLVLVSSLVLLSSCKQDEPKPTPKPPTPVYPSETIVSDDVLVLANQTEEVASEQSNPMIVRYSKDEIVLRVPEKFRAADGKAKVFKSFNTKDIEAMKKSKFLSLKPCKEVPTGALVQVANYRYEGNNVYITPAQPKDISQIVPQVNYKKDFSLYDKFFSGELSGEFEFEAGKNSKVKVSSSFSKDTDIQKVKIVSSIEIISDKKKKVSFPYNDKNLSVEEKILLTATVTLDPVFTVEMKYDKDEKLPRLFKLSGKDKLHITLDADVALDNEWKLEKPITLAEVKLPRILIGGVVYIRPVFAIELNFGAEAHITAKAHLLDYDYPYNFYAGYNSALKERVFKHFDSKGRKMNKLFSLENPFSTSSFEASISGNQDITAGLKLRFLDWDAVEVQAGAGFGLNQNFSYTYDLNAPSEKRHKFAINYGARLFLFGALNIDIWEDVIEYNKNVGFDFLNYKLFDDEIFYGERAMPTLDGRVNTTTDTDVEIIKGEEL